MRVQVLGGLVVHVGSITLTLGTPKQQTVLAVLACNAGHLVSVDQLVDELWPDGPPPSAVPNVRTYAANLRRGIESMLPGREVLVRTRDGYRLLVERTEVDVYAFQSEVGAARALIGVDEAAAAKLLDKALARWQGPMLTGVALGPALLAHVASATEDRMLAAELLAELQIRLGRYEPVLPLLRELLAREPLRERAHLLLMRALHLRNDHAGAIAAYAAARRMLREHLGIEPGAELRKLYRQIVEQERAPRRPPALTSASSVVTSGLPGQSRLRSAPGRGVVWLPRAVPDFVGRDAAVEHLLTETHRVGRQASAVHLVDGMAGSGKTSLAVHVSGRLREHYPDGGLFIDLKGHDRTEKLDTSAALATLLRQLGIPGDRIPPELQDRLALWRQELAVHRLIIVLDNAADAEQVAALLPTSPGCVVIVTSRRRISGLDVSPPLSLPVMDRAEGVALLASAVGAERVAAEPEAAAAVVEHCGRLPLAIRLAGSRLAHRPTWRLADLAKLLDDNVRRLDHLTSRDRTVVGAFAASYESLPGAARRLFRLLSVHPGDQFDTTMASALSGLATEVAVRTLDELLDCHLIEDVGIGRYRMHDLIRQYSRELSLRNDTKAVRDEALGDLIDTMLHLSFPVADRLESRFVRRHVTLDPPRRPDLQRAADEPTEEWMAAQRVNLVALVARAYEEGLHDQSWRLARLLWRFLYVRAYFDDIVSTHRHGLLAARAAGAEDAVAAMHNYLASAYLRKGNYGDALAHVTEAVRISERHDDLPNLVRYRTNLVAVHWIRGELQEAARVGERCLRGANGYGADEVPSFLPNIGLALMLLGRYEEALHLHRLHLFAGRQAGSTFHILNALSHISGVKCRMGRYEEALRALRTVLILRKRTGHRYAEPEARNEMGIVLRCLGRIEEAVDQHETARRLAIESGERHVHAAALNDLALTLAESGAAERSIGLHHEALQVATRIGHPYEQGRALMGLADQLWADDPVAARRHAERALAIFRRMGVPERFEVERRLADPTGTDHRHTTESS
ncbi:BTAD domain-containing putative transcriptional regulator [Micromonospora sp. NPDC003816]|uniref:AfsR/SARP family transcriptional regulator n=1 Tax=Micromonospora sp. NPDC003816 TaxID=3364224 RepID=UPI0036C9C0C2